MAFRSSTDFSTFTGLGAPPGTVASDILILALYETSAVNRPYTCSGWTLIAENPSTPAPYGASLYWALGSVSNFTFLNSASTPITTQSGTISAWSGRNTTTPVTAFNVASASDASTTTTASTVTAAAGDDLIWVATQQNAIAYGAAVGTPTMTDISTGNDGNTAWALSRAENIGAGTTTAYTRTNNTFLIRNQITLALAAGGGAPTRYYLSDMVEM